MGKDREREREREREHLSQDCDKVSPALEKMGVVKAFLRKLTQHNRHHSLDRVRGGGAKVFHGTLILYTHALSGSPHSSQINQWLQPIQPWLLISARSSHFCHCLVYNQEYTTYMYMYMCIYSFSHSNILHSGYTIFFLV